MGLLMIPPAVLVAKITPSHVEATIFSFSQSFFSFSIFFLPRIMGVFWNKVVFHITSDNLEELYKAYVFQACCAFLTLFYVPILPTWAEVREMQKNLHEMNK